MKLKIRKSISLTLILSICGFLGFEAKNLKVLILYLFQWTQAHTDIFLLLTAILIMILSCIYVEILRRKHNHQIAELNKTIKNLTKEKDELKPIPKSKEPCPYCGAYTWWLISSKMEGQEKIVGKGNTKDAYRCDSCKNEKKKKG